jgi:8-oxo-dGTP diphosphatase
MMFAMTQGSYIYDYPRPMVTVDAVVFARQQARRVVLLVERGRNPFAGSWALPGGFVEMEETLETAVARELAEETGVTGVVLRQFHTFGDPGRDPRGRSISVAFVGETNAALHAPRGGDDAAAARWFPVDELPELAFDHCVIVEQALRLVVARESR